MNESEKTIKESKSENDENRESKLSMLYVDSNDTRQILNDKFVEVFASFAYFEKVDEKTSQVDEYKEKDLFFQIIESIIEKNGQITVVIEHKHIDNEYTDTYYNHFSGLHYPLVKYCKRLSFFIGKIEFVDLFLKSKRDYIQEIFVGTMVLKPLRYGFIGRTLLDPHKYISKSELNCSNIYMRLGDYKQHIAGAELSVSAFPFSNQDSCYTTCAEITILNIIDYFSSKYKEYKMALPSEIKRIGQDYQYQRATPSVGLNYNVLSKILGELGFAPRIYNMESISINPYIGDERENEIRRIMHYYIESGIPVGVNVEPRKQMGVSGHSLICIGHSGKIDVERAEKYSIEATAINRTIINSTDFYTEYCVVDDHQKPYSIRNYKEISDFKNMRISNLAVPLYKKMYMEATNACSIFYEFITNEKMGLPNWNIPTDYLNRDDTVVFRVYLASSRSLKNYRVKMYDDKQVKRAILWGMLDLPQFVWCCELYNKSQYLDFMNNSDKKLAPKAFATIILDATASVSKDFSDALIVMETVNEFRIRDAVSPKLWNIIKFNPSAYNMIDGYSVNLTEVSCST